jgi:hypothetical protein
MFFDKPTTPKPLEHWYQDIAAVERLREILSDPILQQASATLLQAAMPSHVNVGSGHTNNERLCWLGGYTDFLRDLNRLTKMPTTRSDVSEWEHIDRELN